MPLRRGISDEQGALPSRHNLNCVTDIPEVTEGDEVVLLGTSGNETITAEALAAAAGSFNYEQLCDISYRVSRVYCQGEKVVGHANYLLGK